MISDQLCVLSNLLGKKEWVRKVTTGRKRQGSKEKGTANGLVGDFTVFRSNFTTVGFPF